MAFAMALGLALLLVSFARLIGDMGSSAFDMQMIDNALSEPLWKTRLGLNIGLFALSLMALHLCFGLACWGLALLSGVAFPAVQCSRHQWTLLWFLAGTAWLMLANAERFAHSSLGQPWHDAATTRFLGASPPTLLAGLLLACLAAVVLAVLGRLALWRRRNWLLAGSASLLLAGAGFGWHLVPHHASSAAQPPSIIFLGIDSLRPDYVRADNAPHMLDFMNGAVHFQDAVTPLARTFPSWMSILTGRHPHTTGAYMNLLPRDLIHTGSTLPQLLREHGYRTYYSMDETRFANIDASYGFDRTLTSTIGGSDFVLSWFADTPLSNMVVNTWLGALLFPHVHANRAAHVTYDPDAFVKRVAGAMDSQRPIFLVSHLTLPHWPYVWAASDTGESNEGTTPDLYDKAVRRADRQFGDMLAELERRGVLENAIVVALSDHGEALGHAEDFMADYFPADAGEPPKSQRWGHGTSVFSPTQYRVVLGIRGFGKASGMFRQPAALHEPVSLVDLAPTILDLLDIESTQQFDGISLAHLLQADAGADTQFNDRIRFTETEYNPAGFTSNHLTKSGLAEAMKIYQLDSATDRMMVRNDAIDMVMSSRQYAALLGKRAMGIAIPDAGHEGLYEFVQAPEPGAPATIPAADAALLRQALEQRFRIKFSSQAAGATSWR